LIFFLRSVRIKSARILRAVREHPCSHLSAQLWIEVAGRMYRQLICDCHWQSQMAALLISIK